jgi:hypothetical protein
MDLNIKLRNCRLMLSRIPLADNDSVVWLFPASHAAATLVGVVHLTQPSQTPRPGGHSLTAVFARMIWSLASELTGRPTAVAVLFPYGAGRVLEIAGVAGEALRFFDTGFRTTVKTGPTHLSRTESVAATLLAHAQRIASAPLN